MPGAVTIGYSGLCCCVPCLLSAIISLCGFFFLSQKPDNSADVTVGTLIALMVDEGDDWRNVEVPAGVEAAPKAAAAGSAPSSPPPAAAPPPPAAPAAVTGTTLKAFYKTFALCLTMQH